jgi:hypothetical protein
MIRSNKSGEKRPQINESSDERKAHEKAQKITKKRKREGHIQALRNHAESSYQRGSYKVEFAARSPFPLTRSHHEALKLVLEIPKENGRGK